MTHENRMFVPLATKPYQWFQGGKKRWELRKYGRQYTKNNVRPGRRVELRRGYADANRALWGTIVNVEFAQDVEQFFDRVSFKEVIPNAGSREEAITAATALLRMCEDSSEPLLGFEVSLDR
jgi:hypothetical protein